MAHGVAPLYWIPRLTLVGVVLRRRGTSDGERPAGRQRPCALGHPLVVHALGRPLVLSPSGLAPCADPVATALKGPCREKDGRRTFGAGGGTRWLRVSLALSEAPAQRQRGAHDDPNPRSGARRPRSRRRRLCVSRPRSYHHRVWAQPARPHANDVAPSRWWAGGTGGGGGRDLAATTGPAGPLDWHGTLTPPPPLSSPRN